MFLQIFGGEMYGSAGASGFSVDFYVNIVVIPMDG
jgi:hypothetical protein